jgi:hypothetical protein
VQVGLLQWMFSVFQELVTRDHALKVYNNLFGT